MPLYETMSKNRVEPDRPQMTIWCMRFACWIPEATNTYSQYVILIAFPLQHWLHTQALMLHYTYTACLVPCKINENPAHSKCIPLSVQPPSSIFQTEIQITTYVILYSTLKPKWDFLFEKLFQSQLHCLSLLLCVWINTTSDNCLCTSSNLTLFSISIFLICCAKSTDRHTTHLHTVNTADLLSLSS
jgi:hypothetical protein